VEASLGEGALVIREDRGEAPDVVERRLARRILRRKTLELEADAADLQIFVPLQHRHADVARAALDERPVLHETQDGVAHRGDARAHLLRDVADLQAVAGAQFAFDQRFGDALVHRLAETHVLDCVEGPGPDARAGAMAKTDDHGSYPASPVRKRSRQSPMTDTW